MPRAFFGRRREIDIEQGDFGTRGSKGFRRCTRRLPARSGLWRRPDRRAAAPAARRRLACSAANTRNRTFPLGNRLEPADASASPNLRPHASADVGCNCGIALRTAEAEQADGRRPSPPARQRIELALGTAYAARLWRSK